MTAETTAEPTRRPVAALEQAVGARYGLSLKDCCPEGLEQRLRFRIHERALDGVESYAEYLLYSRDERAWDELMETLTANESRIFEAPGDFSPVLELPSGSRWARYAQPGAERFRCLSAGCGTGEEAYSLAIALAETRSRANAFDFEVIGVDLSARALGRARRALYPTARAAALPADLRERYFLERGAEISAEPLRPHTRFARLNLCDHDALETLGAFDLVFARGFLLSLTAAGRRAALRNLARAVKPGGILLLGPGESLGDLESGLVPTRWCDRYAYERPPEDGSSHAADSDLTPKPKTALVAHRSSLVRTWVRILFEKEGYEVEEAGDGARALECAVIGPPRERYVLELTLPAQGGPWVAVQLARLGCGTADSVAYLSPRGGAGDGALPEAGPRAFPLPLGSRDLESLLPRSFP